MNNQKTKQAILVTTQDRADQNQTLERLSLFDEEGNPVSINGGSEEVSFFTLKGEWSPFPEEPYVVNDLVYNITADGDSKISTWWLYEESPTGSDPHEDLEHWQILVSDGNPGLNGPQYRNDWLSFYPNYVAGTVVKYLGDLWIAINTYEEQTGPPPKKSPGGIFPEGFLNLPEDWYG